MFGEALALAAALTWSTSVVLFKRSEAISPQGLNLFKNVVAMILLLVTLPLLGREIQWVSGAEDWFRLCVSGILGIAVADTLFFMALRQLGAGRVAVVGCVYAPLIVLLSVIFLDESIGLSFGVGATLVVFGVYLANKGDVSDPLDSKQMVQGVSMAVIAVVAMAIGVVLAKPALERGSLVEVTLVRLIAGVLAQFLWIALVSKERSALSVFRPQPVWKSLLPASVLGSYISMLLWLGGFKWADASVASVLNQLSTIFTIVLARLMLGEPLTLLRVVGGTVAVTGACLILIW